MSKEKIFRELGRKVIFSYSELGANTPFDGPQSLG